MGKLNKEIRIALIAIFAIVLLYVGLNFLKGISLFSSTTDYYVKFKDISGLSASNPIFADGYQVGVVRDIQFDYADNQEVVVHFTVDNQLRIPRGSSAEIISDLMGNVKMNLLLGNNPRERIQPGDTIVGDINSGAMGKLSAMVPAVEQMLPKLDSILTSLNQLLADPALQHSLHNVEAVTANLNTSSQQLNVLMAGLNAQVPAMMDKTNAVLDNTQTLTAHLAAVDIAQTMAQVDQTIANVQQLTDKMNSKEGTLGLLMNDTRLYTTLNTTVSSADSLLTDLKSHPKRYVHFSIFGKKDK
ncbi:MAG: MCE family protein [Prevotella sp.]|nr:MCE family protein [Prevotella sp.]